MAAILCRGCNDVCRGCRELFKDACNCVGTVICLPCRLCGVVTKGLGDIVCSPFSLFLCAAYGLNLPPVVFAFKARMLDGDGCSRVMEWLTGDAILCAINMVAATDIVNKILDDEDFQQSQLEGEAWYQRMGRSGTTRSNSCARTKQVLCDDPAVAVYLLVEIVFLIWVPLGLKRANDDGCDYEVTQFARAAVLCNFLFLFLGSMAFCFSMCCSR